jgi:hypothetical protein
MGYSNSYKLRVEGTITKTVKECQCGNLVEDTTQNFCGQCGTSLIEKEIETDANCVISDFVNEYADGDAGFLLEEDGGTNESGSGYGIDGELEKFSKKYPQLTFILSCQWESGLVEEGEPGTDYFFFKNGIKKQAKSKVVYTNPFTQEIF